MAVDWFDSNCVRVLRDGSSWSEVQGFISDKTRSGKTKRRFAHSMAKRPFSVSMRMTFDEQQRFSYWYKNVCKYGANSFMFPKIDSELKPLTEYRFADGGQPKYNGNSGQLVDVSMEWEEV